ncbi:hypothetical protein [Leptospira noguchii]|uniref:hypothetical protein n=1 Tax=Leptospira noguchii TaxID=28182 RepID=UPI0002D97159|nr:hypothetical protein [Leptospira noguchii]
MDRVELKPRFPELNASLPECRSLERHSLSFQGRSAGRVELKPRSLKLKRLASIGARSFKRAFVRVLVFHSEILGFSNRVL